MLLESNITAFLPTVAPEKSRKFYMNTLGLKLVSTDDYALEFEGKGSSLRITVVGAFEPHPFSVLGFKVEDIVAEVEALIKKGVEFVDYSALKQDELGIWTALSEARVAWFKDPDGNLISLTQYAR